jgi:6-pyruvoyltetrahydropterin/6-carboxytetrahydropterin synthase
MVYIQRREVFSAAHRLYNDALSTEENERLFGKCSWNYGHGHNFEVWVTVKGQVNPETGYVMNLVDLKALMMKYVIEPLDHKHLNHDTTFMLGILPSTENLSIEIWKQLAEPVTQFGAQLHCVRVVETENNAVEYYGE